MRRFGTTIDSFIDFLCIAATLLNRQLEIAIKNVWVLLIIIIKTVTDFARRVVIYTVNQA